MTATRNTRPLYIRMHDADNVAIVANDGGLPIAHGPPPRSLPGL
jgi:hypothetical protein